MSQRSHIAQSGSSAISACSAACRVESSVGISSSPASWSGSGQNQIASVAKLVGGSSSGTSSIRSCERHRPALVADDLLGHLDLAEREARGRAAARLRSGSTIRVIVSFFAWVYQLPANGSTTACSADQVELAHEVRLAEVEVDRAFVHRRVGARALDQAEHRAARAVDDRERVGVGRAQRDLCGGMVACPPRRSRPASARSFGSARAAASASGPSTSASASVSGAS